MVNNYSIENMNKMKKLILIAALAVWVIQPLKAQVGPTGGNDPTAMILVSKTTVVNTSSQKCYRLTFKYRCPAGNCLLKVTKPGTYQNSSSSGAPNNSWKYYSGTVCYNKQSSTYQSTINCQAGSLKDGDVVVIEGG